MVDGVHGDDARVSQACHRLRFAAEALARERLTEHVRRELLDRDLASERGIEAAQDDTHAAASEHAADLQAAARHGSRRARGRASRVSRLEPLARHARGDLIEETGRGARARRDAAQGLELVGELRILGASTLEHRGARIALEHARLVEERVQLRVARGLHHLAGVTLRRSRGSAVPSSDSTVVCETYGARAVSSIEGPPRTAANTCSRAPSIPACACWSRGVDSVEAFMPGEQRV